MQRQPEGGRSTNEEHLPSHRSEFRHRSRTYWEERAESIGEDVVLFVRQVFDSDDALHLVELMQDVVAVEDLADKEDDVLVNALRAFFPVHPTTVPELASMARQVFLVRAATTLGLPLVGRHARIFEVQLDAPFGDAGQ